MKYHELLSRAQFSAMPWKNGKGKTLEILRIEDKQGIILRVSQATVKESGEFSHFLDVDRHLILIKGKGIHLYHQFNKEVLERTLHQKLDNKLAIASFYGGNVTTAKLIQGAIEGLNIMVRRVDHESQVKVVFSSTDSFDFIGNAGYFYANEQSCVVINDTETNLDIPQGSLLCMPKDKRYSLQLGSGVLFSVQAK